MADDGNISAGSGRREEKRESSLEPSLSFALSEGTMQQIMRDNSFLRPLQNEMQNAQPCYYGQVDERDAIAQNTLPHSLAIERETYVLPAGAGANLFENQNGISYAEQQIVDGPSYTIRLGQGDIIQDRAILEANYSPGDGRDIPSISPVAQPAVDFPCNLTDPGQINFTFDIPPLRDESKKTAAYKYLNSCRKLFVRTKVHCPIKFRVTSSPPEGAFIRALVTYSQPQDVADVVKRCLQHTFNDQDTLDHPAHFLRCHNGGVMYDETRRHSVLVPWTGESENGACTPALYEFMCFSSCSGGANRRRMQLICTLEHGGLTFGRQVIDLKVCACPGRDAHIEATGVGTKRKATDKEVKPEPGKGKIERVTSFTAVEPISKRPKDDDEIFTVTFRGRQLHKLVMAVIKNYEIGRQYEKVVNHLSSPEKQESSTPRPSRTPSDLIGLMPDRMSQGTKISSWLKSLKLEKWAKVLGENGMHTMEDLNGRLTPELLSRLGVCPSATSSIYGSYIQWHNLQEAANLSSLETIGSVSSESRQNSQETQGIRVTKTTVKQTYDLAGKKH